MHTKIIGEVGYNHQGEYDIAKQLIDEAAELGLWAVKFQKWTIDEFPEHIKKKSRNDKNSFGKNYYEHRKKLEFSIRQLKMLKNYAEKQGLEFMCSGKDFTAVKELVEMGCKYIKLPSQRYKDNDIFKYLYRARGEKRFNILVSTGMNDGEEALRSRWIDCADVLFHCISLYPAKPKECELAFGRKLWALRGGKSFGYSSHEDEGKAIKYAVAAGATYIERHITLDKTWKGTDHKLSSDVEEMKRIIKEIEEVEMILGDGKRRMTKKEKEYRAYYRSY
jgi:sialic acid synthase SpsE